MSVEIDVLPLGNPSNWATVREIWIRSLSADADHLLGPSPILRDLGSREEIGVEEELAPITMALFDIAKKNTLMLSVVQNEGGVAELRYLEDHARNIGPTEMWRIASAWHDRGYFYMLTSGGGRSIEEPRLLITLAAALAEATAGLVLLPNDKWFSVGVGVYTPAQFREVRWK
jgi:hypothetical protein